MGFLVWFVTHSEEQVISFIISRGTKPARRWPGHGIYAQIGFCFRHTTCPDLLLYLSIPGPKLLLNHARASIDGETMVITISLVTNACRPELMTTTTYAAATVPKA